MGGQYTFAIKIKFSRLTTELLGRHGPWIKWALPKMGGLSLINVMISAIYELSDILMSDC